jgi:hypothetical protein
VPDVSAAAIFALFFTILTVMTVLRACRAELLCETRAPIRADVSSPAPRTDYIKRRMIIWLPIGLAGMSIGYGIRVLSHFKVRLVLVSIACVAR